MATDSDVPEAGKADAMEVDTETEVAVEKQRLRLVNLPSASSNCSRRNHGDREQYADHKG
jgi:hypothetical protein